jgi:hypothetical protein
MKSVLKYPPLARATIQNHFERKIFQFAAEPGIKGHSECFWLMQYAVRQQVPHGPEAVRADYVQNLRSVSDFRTQPQAR